MSEAWAAEARRLSVGAERASAEGDLVAFLALSVAAAQCLQIARNLARAESIGSDT